MLVVNDLMTVEPITVEPEHSLREIITLMQNEGVRQLPVIDEGKLVGMVTDRDIRLVMKSPIVLGEDWQTADLLDNIGAEGIMTTDLVTVMPMTPLYEVADALATYKFGALPVVANGRLVGIISVTDILNYVSEWQREEAKLGGA